MPETVVHVHRTPMVLLANAADDRADRWCFQCRRRLPHSWEMKGDPDPSYYGPSVLLRCSGCGGDHTCFPGTYWDGGHPVPDSVADALSADYRSRPSPCHRRRRRAMMPHEFKYLWLLKPEVEGPQTASEIAETLNRPVNRSFDTKSATVANRIKRLRAIGMVAADDCSPAIYRLTEKGRAYVDA